MVIFLFSLLPLCPYAVKFFDRNDWRSLSASKSKTLFYQFPKTMTWKTLFSFKLVSMLFSVGGFDCNLIWCEWNVTRGIFLVFFLSLISWWMEKHLIELVWYRSREKKKKNRSFVRYICYKAVTNNIGFRTISLRKLINKLTMKDRKRTRSLYLMLRVFAIVLYKSSACVWASKGTFHF